MTTNENIREISDYIFEIKETMPEGIYINLMNLLKANYEEVVESDDDDEYDQYEQVGEIDEWGYDERGLNSVGIDDYGFSEDGYREDGTSIVDYRRDEYHKKGEKYGENIIQFDSLPDDIKEVCFNHDGLMEQMDDINNKQEGGLRTVEVYNINARCRPDYFSNGLMCLGGKFDYLPWVSIFSHIKNQL
jgi:hypothetical protein